MPIAIPIRSYHSKPKKSNCFSDRFANLVNTAAKKGLACDLTRERFEDVTQQRCHYCGAFGERGYVGIDRKDSHGGYVEENCLPCCKTCNFAKNSLPYEAFLAWFDRVIEFRTGLKKKA